MANTIILKAKAVTELDSFISFSVALALSDGTKEVAATFAIDTEEATIPMIGITQYGKLVGLVEDSSTPFTVTATPLDGDVEDVVDVSTTVADLLGVEIGEDISGSSDNES